MRKTLTPKSSVCGYKLRDIVTLYVKLYAWKISPTGGSILCIIIYVQNVKCEELNFTYEGEVITPG